MKRSLLELLRSPVDGSVLALEDEAGDDEIVAGRLVDAGGMSFPIVDGIPFFAQAGAEDPTFGFKWKLVASYGHEEPSRSSRRQWYYDRFGYGDLEGLRAAVDGKLVLDAGCGSGVDTSMFADAGATVVAVDLSGSATKAVYDRLGAHPNVHVVQGDLLRPPLRESAFDYVSADQVLHHTPDTREAFLAVGRRLKPGGRIAIYVYNRKGPIREFADDFIREHATKMSVEECWELCRQLTLLGKALTEVRAEVDVPEDVPLLGIKAGREDVQRFLYWNVLKCFWNEEWDFELNVVVNFDWYHPHFAYRHTPEEVRGWFAEAGLGLDRVADVQSGLVAVGALPA